MLSRRLMQAKNFLISKLKYRPSAMVNNIKQAVAENKMTLVFMV